MKLKNAGVAVGVILIIIALIISWITGNGTKKPTPSGGASKPVPQQSSVPTPAIPNRVKKVYFADKPPLSAQYREGVSLWEDGEAPSDGQGILTSIGTLDSEVMGELPELELKTRIATSIVALEDAVKNGGLLAEEDYRVLLSRIEQEFRNDQDILILIQAYSSIETTPKTVQPSEPIQETLSTKDRKVLRSIPEFDDNFEDTSANIVNRQVVLEGSCVKYLITLNFNVGNYQINADIEVVRDVFIELGGLDSVLIGGGVTAYGSSVAVDIKYLKYF